MNKTPSQSLKRFLRKEVGGSKYILDIGCGDGVLALFLILSLNCKIYGIDLDKGKIHMANKKLKKRITKGIALCRLCDSRDINKKFGKNIFDWVFLVHTLHHLPDMGVILSNARNVLKPDGKIFICEYKQKYGENSDNCPRYSSRKIISMLNTSGFRNARACKVHRNLVTIIAKKSKKEARL